MQERLGSGKPRLLVTVILASCMLVYSACATGSSLIPDQDFYKGKVVDGETKEPISGAVVLAVYYEETKSLLAIAGQERYIVDAKETLTNEEGEFELLFRAHDDALIIFKPGYGVYPRHSLSEVIGERKGAIPPGKQIVYELPKLTTRKERKQNLHRINTFTKIPYEKKMNYIELINRERISLGFRPLTISKGQ